MTLADLDLCRAIAEKDGWHQDAAKNWYPPNSDVYVENLSHPPAYLTDPAETVRMSKELIRRGYIPHTRPRRLIGAKNTTELWWWEDINDDPTLTNDFYERVTAEAYLAMEPDE